MKYEISVSGDEAIEVLDVWDFTEEEQEYLKDVIRQTGLDKWMDIDKTFEKREELECLELEDLLQAYFPDAEVSEVELGAGSSANSSIKIGPAENDEIKNLVLDDKIKFSDKIEHIHLSKLSDLDDSINFFSLPDNEEFLNLMENIETYGVLIPLLVMKSEESDQYIVICGKSRRNALNALFNETQDERYLYAPCIILENINMDSSIIQSIVVSTNLSYRKISKEDQIKSVLLLDDVITKSKRYRSQINVTDIIAEKAGVSRTTANTLRGFRNLSPKALDLLYKKHITRNAARVLSMKDHETQDLIIDGLGNEINDIRKLREMFAGPSPKIYVKELGTSIPETWEMKTKRTLKMLPATTKITLYVCNQEVEGVLNALLPLRGKAASKYQAFKDNEINKNFRVVLNEDHMKQYIKAGRVNRETVDRIKCGEFKEIIKYA